GRYDRLPALAADLVRRQVAVIVATGRSQEVPKAATSTIPIVFIAGGGNPVDVVGVVGSFAHPARNITGVTFYSPDMLAAKRLELLDELVPSATEIASIWDPNIPTVETQVQYAQRAALSLGLQLHILKATTAEEIDAAFANIVQLKMNAVSV